MAAYAGLVDNVDQNVGRLVEFLKKSDRWENTLFLFLSDNGASPFTNPKTQNKAAWDPESKLSVGVAWAYADNTRFRWLKQNQHCHHILRGILLHTCSFQDEIYMTGKPSARGLGVYIIARLSRF